MFDVFTRIKDGFVNARLERRVRRQFNTAKAALIKAQDAFTTEATTLSQQSQFTDGLTVTWNDVTGFDGDLKGVHERQLERLEEEVVSDISAHGDRFLKPDHRILQRLQEVRIPSLRSRAQKTLNDSLDRAVDQALKSYVTETKATLEEVEGAAQTNLRVLVDQQQIELDKIAASEQAKAEVQEHLLSAEKAWASAVETGYQAVLQRKIDEFDMDVRPALIAGVERNRTAAHWIKKLLLEGKTVPQAKLSGVYQQGDQHLQDQLINTITLTVLEDGSLTYRARGRDEGGRFPFEKNYMDPSDKFKKQASIEPQDPTANHDADLTLPSALSFIDQVQIPATSSLKLESNTEFELSRNDRVDRVLLEFAGAVQGVPLDAEESRFRDLPYITTYPGAKHVEAWLERSEERRISVAVNSDGIVAVVIKNGPGKRVFNEEAPEALIECRAAYNEARLMSLFVVALVARVLNGAGDDRYFPLQIGDSDRLHIPSFCIWPLQVDPKGAVTRAATLLSQYEESVLARDDVPRWAVGWTPALDDDASLSDAMSARFTYTAERHLRVLNSTDAGPIEVRKGVNEHDALFKLTRWFKYTCLALGLLWFGGVLSTLVFANAYTTGELWSISLIFSMIGIWRGLICWGLSARARDPVIRSEKNVALSKIATATRGAVGAVVEAAFWRRGFLLIGPAIMVFSLMVAFWVTDWPELPQWLQPGKSDGKMLGQYGRLGNDGASASGFQSALYTGVWALPLLAIGFMRQAYMTLYELVLQRGQLQRKLNSVLGMQQTWRAGQNLQAQTQKRADNAPEPSPIHTKAGAVGSALAQMKTHVVAEIDSARSRFDKGSAANAALVAVIGLLAPFSKMDAAGLAIKDPPAQNFAGLSEELLTLEPELRVLISQITELNPAPTMAQHCAFPIGQYCLQPALPSVTETVLADLRALNKELNAVAQTLRSIQGNPKVTVRAETDDAKSKLEALSRAIEQLPSPEVKAEADTQPALDALARLTDELMAVQTRQIALDPAPAQTSLNDLRAQLVALRGFDAFSLEADASAALRELGMLKAALDHIGEERTTGIWLPSDGEGRTSPYFDFDVTLNTVVQPTEIVSGLESALSKCVELGGMNFDSGRWDVESGVWFTLTDNAEISKLGTEAFNDLLGRAADPSRKFYVLGLADSTGDPTSNFKLSERRADAVRDKLAGELAKQGVELASVSLPLGEAGWLTNKGLPDSAGDENHRRAAVYSCKGPLVGGESVAEGDTE